MSEQLTLEYERRLRNWRKTAFWLDAEEYGQIEALAASQRRTRSDLMREMVTWYLMEHEVA